MNWNEIKERLQAPFPEKEVEWRVARAGQKNGNVWAMVLAYVTNRAIQDRFDNVFGVNNWRNEFVSAPNGGLMCGLSAWDENKQAWVTKWDGADNTEFEAVKGGLSGAMKRSAVQWGVGRYLYGLTENFAIVSDSGANKGNFKDKESGKTIYFRWTPPQLPVWALPVNKPQPVISTGTKKSGIVDIMKKKIVNKEDLKKQFLSMIVDAWKKEYASESKESMTLAVQEKLMSTVNKKTLGELDLDELETVLRGIA